MALTRPTELDLARDYLELTRYAGVMSSDLPWQPEDVAEE